MLNLETVKLYLRIDDNEEDIILEELIEYSKEEIENSTGVKYNPSGNLSTYRLAQLLIIADRYENRSSQDIVFTPNNSLSTLYTKLKYGESNEKIISE